MSNTTCETFEEFIQWILLAFDLDYRGKNKVELYDAFVRYLVEQFRKGRPVTLIIDEAQHLGPKYLEQLRMLSNVNTEKGMVLQTILIGQPELWDVLRSPELKQFAQRISYDYYLGPLEYARTHCAVHAASGGRGRWFRRSVRRGRVPAGVGSIGRSAASHQSDLRHGARVRLRRRVEDDPVADRETGHQGQGTQLRSGGRQRTHSRRFDR